VVSENFPLFGFCGVFEVLWCEAWAGTVDSSKFHVPHLSLLPGFRLFFFFDFVRSISLVSYTPSPEPSKLYL